MRSRFLVALLAILSLLAGPSVRAEELSADDYVAHVGKGAYIVEYGELLLANRRMTCGKRPVVVDPNLDDYAAAYPGFLILNPAKIGQVEPVVAWWIFKHECAHQFRGPDEETADCWAVQRGRAEGWLKPEGIEQICTFIRPAEGDSMHFGGSQRCAIVRRCFGAKLLH
ncbi:MAG: hypothetical protein R3D57_01165 [Hyphomicrobiaceae bacterium]